MKIEAFYTSIPYDQCRCEDKKKLLWKEDTLNTAYFCLNTKCMMYSHPPTWHKNKTLITIYDDDSNL